jgi:hypothetical protein
MKLIYSLIILLIGIIANAQYVTVLEIAVLNTEVKETSGLIYFNGKLITHNDSGDQPKLYEIDTITGSVLRTVIIDNATNIDWEDITQDSLYIYIADIGNNSGDRTDLIIYRVSKTEYLANNNVSADTISYVYNNQTDFTYNYRDTEFDAEALSVFNDSLLIFMKDWVNNSTRTYVLPKTPGNFIAFERDTFNTNGLITGSEYNYSENSFMLCGYSESLSPFIINISNIDESNIFAGTITKIELTDSIGIGQVEAVCLNNNKYYISREEFIYQALNLEPKLYTLNYFENSNNIKALNKINYSISPNPASSFINVKVESNKPIKGIITDISGVIVKQFITNENEFTLDVSDMQNGLYFVILEINNIKKTVKFIKS